MGFDQWMNLYTRFRVVGSKISCIFVAGDETSANSSALVGILKSTSASSLLLTTEYVENDKCVFRTIQLGETAKPISMKYSTKKMQGIKNIMDNVELSGTGSASPIIQDYFHVWAANTGTGDDPLTVAIQVHIEYIVIFSDLTQLRSS